MEDRKINELRPATTIFRPFLQSYSYRAMQTIFNKNFFVIAFYYSNYLMDFHHYDRLYIVYFKDQDIVRRYGECVVGELGRAFGATLQQMVDSNVFIPINVIKSKGYNLHLTPELIDELRNTGVHFSCIDFERTKILETL
jgi:hypothetical protein